MNAFLVCKRRPPHSIRQSVPEPVHQQDSGCFFLFRQKFWKKDKQDEHCHKVSLFEIHRPSIAGVHYGIMSRGGEGGEGDEGRGMWLCLKGVINGSEEHAKTRRTVGVKGRKG